MGLLVGMAHIYPAVIYLLAGSGMNPALMKPCDYKLNQTVLCHPQKMIIA